MNKSGILTISFAKPLHFEWSAGAATDMLPLEDADTQKRDIQSITISFSEGYTPGELKIESARLSSSQRQNEALERMDVLNSILWGRMSTNTPSITFKLNGTTINSRSQQSAVDELEAVTDGINAYLENTAGWRCHT